LPSRDLSKAPEQTPYDGRQARLVGLRLLFEPLQVVGFNQQFEGPHLNAPLAGAIVEGIHIGATGHGSASRVTEVTEVMGLGQLPDRARV
jgi:hypothetical protein